GGDADDRREGVGPDRRQGAARPCRAGSSLSLNNPALDRQAQPRYGRWSVITGVHHFSLSVADTDRSLVFYQDFGFELVSDREVDDYVQVITGVPDARVRIAHLSGFGHNLELIEYKQPRGAPRA